MNQMKSKVNIGKGYLFYMAVILSVFFCSFSLATAIAKNDVSTNFLIQADGEASDSSVPVEKELKVSIQENYGRLPLYFIENKGQINAKVKFYEKARGHTIYFAQDGVYLSLIKNNVPEDNEASASIKSQSSIDNPQSKTSNLQSSIINRQSSIVRLVPLGMQKGVEIVAQEPQQARFNYFIGNNPEKWRTNVPTCRSVVYKEVYPGIDLKFYGNNRQLEYDIIVKPGADPSCVKLQYQGAEDFEITDKGDLSIKLKDGGALVQHKPIIYQEISDKRVKVEGKFKIFNHQSSIISRMPMVSNSQLTTKNIPSLSTRCLSTPPIWAELSLMRGRVSLWTAPGTPM